MSETVATPPITLRFALSHPAHFIALGFGVGTIAIAPGTFGSLLGWWLGRIVQSNVDSSTFAALLVAGFAVGCWACAVTGRKLGVIDHGAMVWDEVIAMALIVLLIPGPFSTQLIAFLLFRFFDVVKPQPIRFFDQRVKNGFGVMLDDLIAALLTLMCCAVWARVFA